MLMSRALMALLITTIGSAPAQPVILFSSEAIQVARDAATEWNRAPLPSNAAFDIPEHPNKIQPGYSWVIYLVGVDGRMTVWINLTTGQVVEPDRCLFFRGPKIQAFATSVRRKTGARPLPLHELANDVGCDTLEPA
jgi:hypothetical protein